MHARALSLCLSLVLILTTAVAASPYACQGMRKGAADTLSEQAMPAMGMAAMKDCPSMQKAAEHGKAKPMAVDCALACYGLSPSVVLGLLPLFSQLSAMLDSPTAATHQLARDYVLGVPTPPPNVA